MAHGVGLAWLAFAVIFSAVHFIGGFAPQPIATVPEISRARLISYVPEHLADFSILDFPKGLAAELEVVTLLIDRPTPIAINEDSVLDPSDQVLLGDVAFGRFEGDVRHARKRHAAPTVRVEAAVGFALADQRSQVARRLPADEEAILHQ